MGDLYHPYLLTFHVHAKSLLHTRYSFSPIPGEVLNMIFYVNIRMVTVKLTVTFEFRKVCFERSRGSTSNDDAKLSETSC